MRLSEQLLESRAAIAKPQKVLKRVTRRILQLVSGFIEARKILFWIFFAKGQSKMLKKPSALIFKKKIFGF
jgi:hypothetical protein